MPLNIKCLCVFSPRNVLLSVTQGGRGTQEFFLRPTKKGHPKPTQTCPSLLWRQGLSLLSHCEVVGSYFFHDLWALNIEGSEESPPPLLSQCFPEVVVSTLM